MVNRPCAPRFAAPAAFVVTLVLLIATAATAQNLVVNDSFDFDITGWTENSDTIAISHRADVGSTIDGGSGPGSLEVRLSYANGGSSGPEQEINGIQEGVSYLAGGSYFLDADDNPIVGADLLVLWYNTDGIDIALDWVSVFPVEFDTWVRVEETVTAPAGAVRAVLRLTGDTPNDSGEQRDSVVFWDDVWFSEEGADEAVQRLFVPAAANVAGLGGTDWTTDGWISNAISFPVDLWAAFLPQGEDNTNRIDNPIMLTTIPANGFVRLHDLVGMLGEDEVSGGLYLEARAQASGLPATLVTVTTHTFTPNPAGEGVYGQGLPAAGPGTQGQVVIPGLFRNPSLRTNVGVLNTSGENLQVLINIRDASGTEIADATWNLAPYGQRQVGLNSFGVGTLTGGTVRITRVGGTGSFRAYTSTVDQESGDAVYNPGL